MTNEVLATTNQVVVALSVDAVTHDVLLDRDWRILIGHEHYGLAEVGGRSAIIVASHWSPPLPFSAPVVAAAFSVIVLLLLFTGYYLIGNLRHKDAPADAKLD